MRGIAILVVLLHHQFSRFIGGWIGVDLFFILSGFLITNIILNEYKKNGSFNLKIFYLKRFLRLYPPLLISILICNIFWKNSSNYFPIMGISQRLFSNLSALLYFNNFAKNTENFSHIWSLSIEVQFYIIWPFFLILLIKKSKKIFFIIILLIINILIFRYYLYYFGPFQSNFFIISGYKSTFSRFDNILLGTLIAFIPKKRINYLNDKIIFRILLNIFFFIFLIIVYCINQNSQFIIKGGFILINLICFLIVLMGVLLEKISILDNRILLWLGTRSYGLYLFHYPISIYFSSLMISDNKYEHLSLIFFQFFSPFIIAEISYRYVEIPILKYISFI